MSLSQTKCLEDGHVNPRTHESKTEFFYCEDQRLALEALLRDGREAFAKSLRARAVRGFLSEPEQEVLTAAVERYDPGSELRQREDADDAESLSLHYWPDVSDVSVPDLDLGWPDCAAYRGVTRVNVYAQPPLDGQAHIKEVVRKAIAQAQKVIAVVMDAFTDVDIFRDLLDASFKRRVSVYILLERTALTHFLSMCERANMHAGHLKNLRVRCMGGAEFYTRSCTRVRGRLGHRFIFVDGDKAVSGSYSFTWMSSRLDRHLITVVTGQAVETFDRVFRDLYVTSSAVNLQRITTEPEPEPEPLPQPAPPALPSAAVARKLYNPKYALLAIGTKSPSPTSSSGHNSPKDSNSQNPPLPQSNRRRRRVNKEATVEEAPPLHPGLLNLERAYLIPYLPTWPEPDPPSDVIGFINVRDASRPTQVHLQRSERFETSQAIRFSSPISMPEKVLPVIAQPRQIAAKKESSARCKVEPTPGDTKPEETMPDKMKPGQLDARPSSTDPKRSEQGEHATGPKTQTADLKLVTTETPSHTLKSEPKMMTTEKPDTPAVNNGRYLSSGTPTNENTSHNTTPKIGAHTFLSNNASTLNMPVKATHPAHTNNPTVEPLPMSKKDPPGQATPHFNTNEIEKNTLQVPTSNPQQTCQPASSQGAYTANTVNQVNTGTHKQTENIVAHTDSNARVRCAQLESPLKNTTTPSIHNHTASVSVSPAPPLSVSAISDSDGATVPLNRIPSVPLDGCTRTPLGSSSTSPPSLPLLPSFSTTPETPVNSVLTSPISTPPMTKPRTILLVIKAGDGDPDTEEVTVMRRAQSHPSTALVMERIMGVCDTQSGPDSVPCFEKETEAVLELHNKSGMKTGVLDEDTNWGKPRDEHSVTKQSGTQTETQETCEPETERESDCWSRKGAQVLPETKMQAQSDNFLTNAPQMDNTTPKNIPTTPQLQPGNDSKLPQQNESSTAPNETSENVTQSKYIPMASVFHPSTAGPLPAISLTSKTNTHSSVSDVHTHKHDPISANHIYKQGVDDDDVQESGPAEAENVLPTHSQQGVMTHCTNDRTARTPQSVLNTAEESQQPKANGSSHTPKKDLCLHFSDSAPLALEVPSLTPDRDTRSHTPVFRTPDPDLRTNTPDPRSYTPDFRTPDPDLRTNTPDPRSYTPDFRTPTPDVSDGCISPRDDSTLSTTSEEYYECSESPFSEFAIERLASRGQRTTENFPATQPSSGAAKASTRATSSMSGTSDSSDSCGLSLTSSTPQTRQKTRNDGNQGNRREECEENTGCSNKHSASSLATTIPFSIPTPRNTHLPVATLSVPADAWDRKDPEGVEREQSCHKVEMSPVGPLYRCVMDDVQETPGELSSERELASKGSEPKRLSADEFKTGKFPTKERKSKDLPSKGETLKECFTRGERVAETQARGPSGAEKRGRPLAFTKTEVKKAVQAPPRSPSWQQQVGCAALQAPPSRPSRPYPAPQPPGGINQVGSKLIYSSLQALENNRTLSRLIPAYGAAGVAAAGPKRSQGGSSPGRHSSPYRQPPTEQGRARAGRSRSQPPYTQASFLYTQPNIQTPLQLQTQLHSSQNQAARQGSALGSRTITGAVGHEHGKTSLSLSFGRLYNIKGLKEKVSKPSLQSKRSSTTSPPQGHKSTG